ncbi:S9 family peptidase [bacterium]|nr:S9 family peptidase [bacterium]
MRKIGFQTSFAVLLLALLGLSTLPTGALAQGAPSGAPAAGIAPGEPNPSMPAPDPALVRYLGIKGNGGGRFSADGKWLAFSTSWTGTYQKWLMPSDGGFPRQITYGPDAIGFCDFSFHDPGLMIMGLSAGGNERTQIYTIRPDGTGQTPVAYDPAVWHNMGDWTRDGRYLSYSCNKRDERFFDIYVQELDAQGKPAGEPRLVLQKDAILGAGSFSPSGLYMLVSEANSNVDNNVSLLNWQTGELVLLTPHEGEANFGDFCWADDNTLYFVTNEKREFMAIARMSLPPGGALAGWNPSYELVHTPEMDVTGINVSDNGAVIGWSVNDKGFERASLAALPGFEPLKNSSGTMKLRAPEIPDGLQSVGQFDRQNRYVIFQCSGSAGPGDMYRYDLRSGSTMRLTQASLGGLDPAQFVAPRLVEYPSFDNLKISAILYEPRGSKPAGGWPVIVEAHGGPEGQSQPWFDPQVQYYLSRGVAVMLPNPRGSSGYGKTFMTLDNIQNRWKSVADYAAAYDWLVAQKIGDPRRIAIAGGSYGGYVVLESLCAYPDKWCAGVDSFGIANFISFLENTAPYRRPLREAEYGYLEADRDFLVQASPINKVDKIKAPLLILQGANDPRVPLSEAQQMYDALRARNHDVDLIVFPDEGHGWQKIENRAIAWQREVEFLSQRMRF